MEEKITLDREAFKSLASDTRVSILKSLDMRRKMLTELSKELDMSPSTVKEHMDSLRKADLVVLKDDGHKWKYYELTRNGKNILHPGDTKVWILLSLSGLAFFVTVYDMFRGSVGFAASQSKSITPLLTSGAGDLAAESAPAPMALAPAATLPYMHIIGLVLFAGIFAVTLGFYLGKRKISWPDF
jgi:DNA-binding transcriptional ArsR family regulator